MVQFLYVLGALVSGKMGAKAKKKKLVVRTYERVACPVCGAGNSVNVHYLAIRDLAGIEAGPVCYNCHARISKEGRATPSYHHYLEQERERHELMHKAEKYNANLRATDEDNS